MPKILWVFLAATVALAGCASAPKRTRTTYHNDSGYDNAGYNSGGYTSSNYNTVPAAAPSAQSEQNKKILKQAVLGAATGAIASEASGGKAGTGALIGAGTNVLGGALFDMLTAPQPPVQQNPQYAPYVNQWNDQNQGKKKIIRKYDSNGNVVSEEEVWQ